MMMMMMIQFFMLMLMMSSAALVNIHKMSTSSVNTFTFAAQVLHLDRSQASSEKVETSETYKTFITFGHFWSGVDAECNNISGNHILCTHLSIHNLLWWFQAVQHHKSLSWANTNYHCAANGGYLTSCGGNWIGICFFYQNLVGLRKKLNVPLFLCFTLPASFTLKNDTT
jgi:hypothetical protein